MIGLLQDMRYGLRLFRKYPIISAVIVCALAIGIGANTSIFTVINSVLLRPLPFDKEDRLVVIYSVSVPNFMDWKEQNKVLEAMTAYDVMGLTLTAGTEPQRIDGVRVAEAYFQTLGVSVWSGREFSADDQRIGATPVVILTHSFWRQAFGGDIRILGQSIQLSGKPHEVIGIMPPNIQFPRTAQVLLPFKFEAKDRYNRGSNFLTVVGRLRAGKPLSDAQTEFDALNQRIEQQYHTNVGRKVVVYSVHERMVRDIRPLLLLLQVAVALILLIAVANIANLLIAWSGIRKHELAVRLAHGASRSRIVRQLLTECILMSFTGCALGLLLATQATKIFVALLPAGRIPSVANIEMDWRVVLVAITIAATASVGFGLAPILHFYRTNVGDILKQGGKAQIGSTVGSSLRRILAISELAFALLLLISSGLTLKSFSDLRKTDPGFQPNHLLTFQMNIPPTQLNEVIARFQTITEELTKVGAIPGVSSSTISISVPLEGRKVSGEFHIASRDTTDNKLPVVEQQAVGPRYFQTMGIPVLRGRDFSEADNETAHKVTLVSKALADKYFANEDPVGHNVAFADLDGTLVWMQIIGVVGNVKSTGLDRESSIVSYYPLRQLPFDIAAAFLPLQPLTIIVRTTQDPAAVTQLVRAAVYSVDRSQPISNLRTMNAVLLGSIAEPRLESFLLSTFAVIAVLLAIMGVYAVMNSLVQQREREIGVRMALGGTRGRILKMIVGEASRMTGIAMLAGLLLSFVVMKVLASWLYGAKTFDWEIFLVAPVGLFGVALIACFFPAFRASQKSPLQALRIE
ncbi:MAG: ABC transporter permease [Candidatus Angelobacter sp.]